MNEPVGVGGPPGRFTVYRKLTNIIFGTYKATAVPANGPIDWNNNHFFHPFDSELNVTANINRLDEAGCTGDGLTTLFGHDDWHSIVYSFTPPAQPESQPETLPTQEPEMTADQVLAAEQSLDFDGDGFSNAVDNCPAVYNPDQADADGNGVGDVCQVPTSCPTIIISPADGDLPNGIAGSNYNQTITQSGGVGTIAFTRIIGTLPNGLSLGISTGQLAGTPTEFGSFFFTVNATDQTGCAGTANYRMTINAPPPSYVTVSGRVLTSDGRGLRNATVSITDSQGVIRTATTSSFGFFSFPNVTTGGVYTISIGSRLYRFIPRTVQVIDNLTLADFVGLE